MSLNNSEFDEIREDHDADEPLDGRDSQPAPGSSDAPTTLDSIDPLRSVDAVLEENDRDPLQLNPETLVPEPQDEQRSVEDTQLSDTAHQANQPDQRQDPDRN